MVNKWQIFGKPCMVVNACRGRIGGRQLYDWPTSGRYEQIS